MAICEVTGIGLVLARYQPWQAVKIANDVSQRAGFKQCFLAIPQNKSCCFLWVSLLFFNNKKRRFMGVPKNGKRRRAMYMINRIIAPFATGNTATISGKNLP